MVKDLSSGGFGLLASRRGIRGPEMAPATLADPELIGRPCVTWRGVAKFHLIAAALAANVDVHLGHIHGF